MESIHLPISKSIANRCLILAALIGFDSFPLPADPDLPNDVRVMKHLLFGNQGNDYNAEDAGTVFRFMTAFLCTQPGTHVLYGSERLNSRPIEPLVKTLQQIGAQIKSESPNYRAPLYISGKFLKGGEVTLDASLSSQFVSALLLIAPFLESGLTIELLNPVSKPYIQITYYCLRKFGLRVLEQDHKIRIPPLEVGNLKIPVNVMENDWSSASYWYALCAVSGKSFRLKNLSLLSIQGDKMVLELFLKLGVQSAAKGSDIEIHFQKSDETDFEFEMNDCPDLVPALVVACAVLNMNATFKGLETLRYKESDRTLALQIELKKIGIDFISVENTWQLRTSHSTLFSSQKPLELNTYNDHRLAMAFASIKAILSETTIHNKECVHKSYPMFWNEFERVYATTLFA